MAIFIKGEWKKLFLEIIFITDWEQKVHPNFRKLGCATDL